MERSAGSYKTEVHEMTYFFELEMFATRNEIELMEKDLEEKVGERCVILPNCLKKATPTVFFLCDRKACDKCHPECTHTADISHAVNFKLNKFGQHWEGDANVSV
jgi:hypothetical protein